MADLNTVLKRGLLQTVSVTQTLPGDRWEHTTVRPAARNEVLRTDLPTFPGVTAGPSLSLRSFQLQALNNVIGGSLTLSQVSSHFSRLFKNIMSCRTSSEEALAKDYT